MSTIWSTPEMTVGAATLPSRVWVAPMEGVSDVGFRRMAAHSGAAIVYTEMLRGAALAKHNKSTLGLIDTLDDTLPCPTGMQLFVTSAAQLNDALSTFEELAHTTHPHFMNVRVVDLNFGCPSPDVIRIGAGPAMLKRRGKLGEIFAMLRSFKELTKLPIQAVGVKIRLGLNEGEKNHKVFVPVVELANDTVDYIVVHGRHAGQKSTAPADWAAIAEAKARAKIPLIGNGDALTHADVARMVQQTGVDGVMVARAAMRDPFCVAEMLGRAPLGRTRAEIVAAQTEWNQWAIKRGPREKYDAFHKMNFARLLERAAAWEAGDKAKFAQLSSSVAPKNAHAM